jgi:hypothetical protein
MLAGSVVATALSAISASMRRAWAQSDNLVATPARPATLSLATPPRTTGNIYLDLWVRSYAPPLKGAVEAVVSLGVAGSNDEAELGRFAVFPHEPFVARESSQARGYRFNASVPLSALKAGDGPLLVRVRLLPTEPNVSPEGAEMRIDRAAFSASS